MIFDIFDDSFEPPFLQCPDLPLRGPYFVRGGGISRYRSQTSLVSISGRDADSAKGADTPSLNEDSVSMASLFDLWSRLDSGLFPPRSMVAGCGHAVPNAGASG
jgi:hypothetical protein